MHALDGRLLYMSSPHQAFFDLCEVRDILCEEGAAAAEQQAARSEHAQPAETSS